MKSQGRSASPTRVGRKALGALLLAATASLLASGDSSETVKRCASLLQTPGQEQPLGINDGTLSRSLYEEIALTCAASFRMGGGPSAGLGAARASYHLSRLDEALRWVQRLQGTTEEVEALGIAAAVHLDNRNLAQERAVRLRVRWNFAWPPTTIFRRHAPLTSCSCWCTVRDTSAIKSSSCGWRTNRRPWPATGLVNNGRSTRSSLHCLRSAT